MKRMTMATMLLAGVVGLTSCTSVEDGFIFTTNLVQAGATNRLRDLEKTRDELLPEYEKGVKKFQGDIELKSFKARQALSKQHDALVQELGQYWTLVACFNCSL